ncbi:unnamed protein product [Cylindrotheca closterium]|uniref:VWFD domain-containing protein n=1 Tax=Cylindrotheca closterium TaxID=2856 RepID=A0AAD2CFC7_9STRA|nr:unnamed protein product [Cylindrotheca closterium]
MKLNLRLIVLVTFGPALILAGDIGKCSEQASCIDFTIQKTSNCFGEDCGIQVCMIVDTEKEGCPKEENISHLCSASSGGCAAYDTDGVTPLTGKGTSSDCTSTTFDGKCEPETYGGQRRVEMCQEGKPGETVYWALKDAEIEETGSSEYTGFFTFEQDFTTCSPTIKCLGDGHSLECAAPNSDMTSSTRVWEYTIPANDGNACDLCGGGGTPTSPTPTPNPPTPASLQPISTPSPVAPTPGSDIEPTPGSNGDPHFKTWKNEHFEYHGQCDLVLIKDEDFADGLGLDIQLRTKLVRYWSYIRNAAVRIGHDIIELEGSGDGPQDQSVRYWYNMQFRSDEAKTLGGFPMEIRRVLSKKTKIEIDLNSKYPGIKIVLSTYKEFVKVEVEGATEEAFGNSIGLLGDFQTGETLARDGKTYMHDFREYGEEWQVSPVDDMLFHSTEEPQFPKKCLEPEDPRGHRRRRLDESNITMEQAEKACSRLKDPLDQKDCIYDILATQDVGMVGAF